MLLYPDGSRVHRFPDGSSMHFYPPPPEGEVSYEKQDFADDGSRVHFFSDRSRLHFFPAPVRTADLAQSLPQVMPLNAVRWTVALISLLAASICIAILRFCSRRSGTFCAGSGPLLIV